jgi:hypothetical protein
MREAFFPHALVHLVRLGRRVRQRPLRQEPLGVVVQAVPQVQQVAATAPQLAGQPGGQLPAGDAAQVRTSTDGQR